MIKLLDLKGERILLKNTSDRSILSLFPDLSASLRNAVGLLHLCASLSARTADVCSHPRLCGHLHECESASSSADLWLSAVKAVTILQAAVQYKHFPFNPVPRRAHEPAKKRLIKKNRGLGFFQRAAEQKGEDKMEPTGVKLVAEMRFGIVWSNRF